MDKKTEIKYLNSNMIEMIFGIRNHRGGVSISITIFNGEEYLEISPGTLQYHYPASFYQEKDCWFTHSRGCRTEKFSLAALHYINLFGEGGSDKVFHKLELELERL